METLHIQSGHIRPTRFSALVQSYAEGLGAVVFWRVFIALIGRRAGLFLPLKMIFPG